MPLIDDLKSEVNNIFKRAWSERDGQVVPSSENLQLSNDGVNLDATVLYADMSDSTVLVDDYKPHFAAEIYKSYLHCAAKIIRNEGGEITAYDGDRIMAVFIGGSKNTNATRSALKINYVVKNLINPLIKENYQNTTFTLNHTCGVDTSKILVARTGIRGANDLVWVGSAANHAAKLCSLDDGYSLKITGEVFTSMNEELRSSNGRSIWEAMHWGEMKRKIYRSNWTWKI